MLVSMFYAILFTLTTIWALYLGYTRKDWTPSIWISVVSAAMATLNWICVIN